MRWRLLLTVVLGLILGSLTPATASALDLIVVSPTDGAVITGDTVTIVCQVSDFNIVPSSVPEMEAGQQPQANRPGEGHVHFTLDLSPMVIWGSTEPYTFTDVPAGEHLLRIELVENDHSSLSPPVVRQIRFRTEAAPTTADTATLPNAGAGGGVAAPTAGPLLVALATVVVLASLCWRRRPV